MSKYKDQPAFPFVDSASPMEHPGMTLRDYFAAKALPAIAAAYVEANGRCIGTDHFPRNVAAHAYTLADAMMKEREA